MRNKQDWLVAVLSAVNIKALNEMQEAAMEASVKHKDIILLSATGSGKTLAFLVPLVPLLKEAHNTTKALIIVPSRELALQIEMVFKSMQLNIKVSCCYGGHKREIEENNLLQAPPLIIGTPGRLADHIRRGNIKTAAIETLVLDEFDKSLELGFQEEMQFIISSLPAVQKRLLTSATSLEEIPAFIGLTEPKKLDFLSGNEDSDTGLEIKILESKEKDKLESLFRLICMLGNRSTIIFCNHRESVERTSELLKEKDIHNVFYHGAMEQQERDAALCKFRNGTSSVLVTTDLAARGLDIANIRYIIHYHLPHTEDIFTHRNGRTARMDASGTAILIIGPDEKVPSYISPGTEKIELPATITIPDKPKWTTLFIAAGKKDKVNKIDIVGFLTNKGQLKKEDIGLIDVKDFFSFVAIKKIKVNTMLHQIKDEKIKNKKVKIDVAK
ncbi:MAG: DEAD/DEAH box helicase [Sphingobacteriales bacterium]|nr:DEAD/DEAH box helicase [Sphingobacteriales bacterium]